MLIEMTVAGLTIDPYTNAPIVILKDKTKKTALPIWIGILEASAIATELENIQFSRPMTHDLMKEMLVHTGASITKIEVNDIKDNVYHATIHLNKDKNNFKMDARPSDAIALALRTSSPIFVHEDVINKSKKINFDTDGDSKGADNKDINDLLDKFTPEDFGKYKM